MKDLQEWIFVTTGKLLLAELTPNKSLHSILALQQGFKSSSNSKYFITAGDVLKTDDQSIVDTLLEGADELFNSTLIGYESKLDSAVAESDTEVARKLKEIATMNVDTKAEYTIETVGKKAMNEAFDKLTNLTTAPTTSDLLAYADLLIHDPIKAHWLPAHGAMRSVLILGVINGETVLIPEQRMSATDILGALYFYNGKNLYAGDKPSFASMPRAKRKLIVTMIVGAKYFNEETLAKHNEPWKRLFHSLHIGEYIKGNEEAKHLVNLVRTDTARSYESHWEEALGKGNAADIVDLARRRPATFCSKLISLLKMDIDGIAHAFSGIIHLVPVAKLFILSAELKRIANKAPAITLPNSMNDRINIREYDSSLDKINVKSIYSQIVMSLKNRLKPDLKTPGKIQVADGLENIIVESGGTSNNSALRKMTRGSIYPCPDLASDFFTMFLYWKGRDVDITAIFHDADHDVVGVNSFNDLKTGEYAVHSDDIRNAPLGAAEYINIDTQRAKDAGVRYVLLTAVSWDSGNFSEIEECCLGWLKANSLEQESYNPDISQAARIDSYSKGLASVYFDLEMNTIQWLDIPLNIPAGTDLGDHAHRFLEDISPMFNIVDSKLTLGDIASVMTAIGLESVPVTDDVLDNIITERSTLSDIVSTMFDG